MTSEEKGQRLIVVLIVWCLPPLAMIYTWLRYLVRHDWIGTSWHILLVVVSVSLSVRSVLDVLVSLRGTRHHRDQAVGVPLRILAFVFCAGSMASLGLVCFIVSAGVVDFGEAKHHLAKLDSDNYSTACTVMPENIRKEETSPALARPTSWGPGLLGTLGWSPVADISGRAVSEKSSRPLGNTSNAWKIITGARLTDRNLNFCLAHDAFLVNADLSRSLLFAANLENADCRGASLKSSRLDYAECSSIDLRSGNLAKASLRHANLQHAQMQRCFLQDTHLENANLQGARLDDAEAVAAHFEWAQLEGTVLKGAKLNSAHFEGAVLTGAKFEGADFTSAVFKGTKVDQKTREKLERQLTKDQIAGLSSE